MKGPLVSDIPSIKKSLQDAHSMRLLGQVWPVLRPVFKSLGADVDRIDEAILKSEDLIAAAQNLATIPDRFDDLFVSRGWAMYEMLELDVAVSAVQKAESGDTDGAEADLVEHYDPPTVQKHLRWMTAIQAFQPRMRLAERALSDYAEERYHACVPVVLALLDGLVNELHEKSKGFFAEGVKLEAWDSIAAHSKGLNGLVGVFQKGRRKTTTEPITIPYRNGIMHGMDLGYDNRTVAAKTWAALFAVRDWAVKAERGLLEAPPKEQRKTWLDLIRERQDLQQEMALLDKWKPREVGPGQGMPATGAADAFERDTPERKLAEFLCLWKKENYGGMARCLSGAPGYSAGALPALVRRTYASKRLVTFEFVEVKDTAPALSQIETRLVYDEEGVAVDKQIRFEMRNEDREGILACRGMAGTGWAVSNWRTL